MNLITYSQCEGGNSAPQINTRCNYYVLTDNDWLFVTSRRQAAAVHRHFNLGCAVRHGSASVHVHCTSINFTEQKEQNQFFYNPPIVN